MKHLMKKIVALLFTVVLSAAAMAGIEEGQAAYAKKDYATAFKEFVPLAQKGDANAQYHLGVMYERGNGVPEDAAKAVEWFRKAAAQGDAYAQSYIGWMYSNGKGVPKDKAKAVEWYQKAAAQENKFGQYDLGEMYFTGEGVSKDFAKAVELWQKAAAQGHVNAQAQLDKLGLKKSKDVSGNAMKIYIALAVITCIAIFILIGNCRRYGLISKTKTSAISLLQDGYYEIKGKVVSLGEQLISPYSEKPCVYYQFNVEERKGQGAAAYYDSIIEDEKFQKFGVDDGSGIAIVDLQNADIQIKIDEKNSSGFMHSADENQVRVLGKYNENDRWGLGGLLDKEFKYVEKYLEVGDDIFILGEVNGQEQSKPLFKQNKLPLIVSDKTEKELLTNSVVWIIFAIASLVAVAWGFMNLELLAHILD